MNEVKSLMYGMYVGSAWSPVVQAFAAASAHFTDVMDVMRLDWAPELPPVTVSLGKLGATFATARHLLPADEVSSVLALVERSLEGAEGAVADAVATGFLQSYSSTQLREGITEALMLASVGPRARRYLEAWHAWRAAPR